MEYNDRKGVLTIEFSNIDENPVETLREKNIKTLLTLPDGWTKNPHTLQAADGKSFRTFTVKSIKSA
jgi:hypothetical protein